MVRNPIHRRSRWWDRDGSIASYKVPTAYLAGIADSNHAIVVLERYRPRVFIEYDRVQHASGENCDLLAIGIQRVVRHIERFVDDTRLAEQPRQPQNAHLNAWAEG